MNKLLAIIAILVLVSACVKSPEQPITPQGDIEVQGDTRIQELPGSTPTDDSLLGGGMNLGSPI